MSEYEVYAEPTHDEPAYEPEAHDHFEIAIGQPLHVDLPDYHEPQAYEPHAYEAHEDAEYKDAEYKDAEYKDAEGYAADDKAYEDKGAVRQY